MSGGAGPTWPRRLADAVAWPLRVEGPRDPALASVIVVLGAPLASSGALSAVAQERVDAAAELWRRGAATRIVACGGVTRGAARSEAAAMADALVAQGVPAGAIVLEQQSRTTAQNATECARLLGDGPREVWLVTQPFHARRARWCFRRAGLVPLVWSIEDSLEHRHPARALRWSLREYLAWTKALLSSVRPGATSRR
ncbi:MAG: YdcF family protein [Kofleriaceae bacterium]